MSDALYTLVDSPEAAGGGSVGDGRKYDVSCKLAGVCSTEGEFTVHSGCGVRRLERSSNQFGIDRFWGGLAG